MAALDHIVNIIFRIAQITFACVVAAIIGIHLLQADSTALSLGRLIYTEVVAGIAIFVSLIRLLPFSTIFGNWPVDFFVSVLWWVAFGLLVNLVGTSCGAVFNWQNVAPRGDQCGQFKANIAFIFLSAIVWLASASITVVVVRYERRNVAARSSV